MVFNNIIGQKQIKEHLIQGVQDNKMGHAQLFLGPEGSGTLPMAVAYACYINCLNRTNDDACGVCNSCRKFSKLIHPDLHFVFPVNTGKNLSGDPVSDEYLAQWREYFVQNPYLSESQWYDYIGIENKQGFIGVGESKIILKKLGFKSFESDFKIMIIWLPERMNASAANKLLKIIEEPPENTIFLMISQSTIDILPTILSRVQVLKFPRIDDNDIRTALKEKHGIPDNQLDNIVHLANGNYRKALDLITDSEENKYNLDRFSELMRRAYAFDIPKIIGLAEEISAIGRERQKRFLNYVLRMVRENFMINIVSDKIVYLTPGEKDFSAKFHPFINSRNASGIYRLINKASLDIEANANARIVFTDTALHLNKLLKS